MHTKEQIQIYHHNPSGQRVRDRCISCSGKRSNPLLFVSKALKNHTKHTCTHTCPINMYWMYTSCFYKDLHWKDQTQQTYHTCLGTILRERKTNYLKLMHLVHNNDLHKVPCLILCSTLSVIHANYHHGWMCPSVSLRSFCPSPWFEWLQMLQIL